MIPTPFVVFVQKSLDMTRSKARKRVPFEWIVALVVYMMTSASPYRVTGLASVVNFNILSPNSLTINLIMNPFVVLVQTSLFMTRFFFQVICTQEHTELIQYFGQVLEKISL